MREIKNTRVAVVGGAGFLGSHLVNHLIEDRGCEVMVVDNLVAGQKEYVHPKARFEHHDITGSEERLLKLFKGYGSRFVFNYAAAPYVPMSCARPIHVANVNFFGAMKVINAAQEAGAEAILQVSSAELYGQYPDDSGKGPKPTCTEETPIEPHSSYGASKAAVDSWVQVRWREAKTPCIALRQFNCVGERETHPYVIPEIISQLAKQQAWDDFGMVGMSEPVAPNLKVERGRVLKLRTPEIGTVRLGNNSARDFMYAGDAVRMATLLLERGSYGEVYNLGSESSIKIYDLAKLIGKVMGFSDVRVEKDESRVRPWEIWALLSCNAKIRSVIGDGGSMTSLKESLKKTLVWYEGSGRKWSWE